MENKTPTLVLSSDSTRTSACSLYNVIEADYLQPFSDDSSLAPSFSETDQISSLKNEDQLDTQSIEILIKKLSAIFSKSHMICKKCCYLLVPPDVVGRIAVDVVRMSQLEPRGVEGGRLRVRLSAEGCETELCTISKDDTKDTEKDDDFIHEIILTLTEDTNSWLSFRQLAQMLPAIVCCRVSAPRKPSFVCVGQGYMLEKVKFYSPYNKVSVSNVV